MPITIKIGKPNKGSVRLDLNVRRSMSGDLMIFDHGDIDIIVSAAKNKVITFYCLKMIEIK